MILATRATGNVSREVVSRLLRAGATVRASPHNPEPAVHGGGFGTVSLEACLDGVEVVPALPDGLATRALHRLPLMAERRR